MKGFISLNCKTVLGKLHNAEHADFFERGIISTIKTLVASLPIVVAVFAVLESAWNKEDALFKQSQASEHTKRIAWLHEKRIALYLFFWYCVYITGFDEDALSMKAADELQFVHNNYKEIGSANYSDTNGLMTNFIEDCEKPQWQQHIQTLNLMPLLTKMKTAHNELKGLYSERSFDKEVMAQLGKLRQIRGEVDTIFINVIESVNAAWIANEYGAKDQTVRANLIEVKEHIAAAVHQAELTLARRGAHHSSHTQNPDTTLPDAPYTPPQNPDANPPAVNPDDLNPPSVGEL